MHQIHIKKYYSTYSGYCYKTPPLNTMIALHWVKQWGFESVWLVNQPEVGSYSLYMNLYNTLDTQSAYWGPAVKTNLINIYASQQLNNIIYTAVLIHSPPWGPAVKTNILTNLTDIYTRQQLNNRLHTTSWQTIRVLGSGSQDKHIKKLI